jgi:hypothetical protein
MDESQESTKTISAAKFFDKIEYVAQIANDALATSTALQSELSTVQIDLKGLIESLQVNFDSGVQNIQNQINEVTNVIVQEQGTRKSETEALEQQIFAQEDQFQKNVKGKKAKKVAPDSFAGKMRQTLRDKAKENASDLGLLGAGIGLAALGGGGNWFTGLFDRIKNFDGRPNAYGFYDSKDLNSSKNNEDDGDGENNNTSALNVSATKKDLEKIKEKNKKDGENNNEEITEGINTYQNNEDNEEKKFLGVGFSDLKETFEVFTLKTLYDQLFPNDKGLLNMFNNKKENGDEISSTEESSESIKRASYNPGLGYNPFGPEGGSTYGDPRYVSTKKKSKHVDLKIFGAPGLGGYIPGDGKGGSTYGDPNYDPYRLFKSTNTTDNNSNNEFVDGGTTVIEGGTEVVDGGTQYVNNQRGEVRASTSLVKPTNSPVLAVKLSESNSIKELAIGA